MPARVFLSHTTRDDQIAAKLRRALEDFGIEVWIDSLRFAGGEELTAEIKEAIEQVNRFVVMLSEASLESEWVRTEVRYASTIQELYGPSYRIVPILLSKLEPSHAEQWLGRELVCLRLAEGTGAIDALMPSLLAALGERAPVDPIERETVDARPVRELLVQFTDAEIDTVGGNAHLVALATLELRDVSGYATRTESFRFVSPLGTEVDEELTWYLDRYVSWPSTVFQGRAQSVQAALTKWGQALHRALVAPPVEQLVEEWLEASDGDRGGASAADHVLTIQVDGTSGTPDSALARNALLSLPWELLHDGTGYLFQGAEAVHIRRSVSSRRKVGALVKGLSLRALIVSPRPVDEVSSYIDHRVSAIPIIEALSALGELATFQILQPATFASMEEELQRAADRGEPYHIVHFGGHGVYDRARGLGGLCFEHAADARKPRRRRTDVVLADRVSEAIRGHGVPLFFLEACQSAKAETDPAASVAGKLVEGGVAAVIAMSHTVLVETARRLVSTFYTELIQGATVGRALVASRRRLRADRNRGRFLGADFVLDDWFVPVLFQRQRDARMLETLPSDTVKSLIARRRELKFGDLPPEPDHAFTGRSSVLLEAERVLAVEPYVMLQGLGGEGKTTVAAELARWLVKTRRADRVAFVPLDKYGDRARTLFRIGDQLVPNFVVESRKSPEAGWNLVERAIADQRTVVVLDNAESLLPTSTADADVAAEEGERYDGLNELWVRLQNAGAKLIFTSRESLQEPFARNVVRIGRLEPAEAVRLVANALGAGKLMPHTLTDAESEEEIARLAETAGYHARSLVLLTHAIVESGVRLAAERFRELMVALERKNPGNRELSLLASVELSLGRLSPEVRKRIRDLGVFDGGALVGSIAYLLDLNAQDLEMIVGDLVRVGLAERLGTRYLRFDPALCPLLRSELTSSEYEVARDEWWLAMFREMDWIQKEHRAGGRDYLTYAHLDVSSFVAATEYYAATEAPERAIKNAAFCEAALEVIGANKARDRVARLRERLQRGNVKQGRTQFIDSTATIDRLLSIGQTAAAVQAAAALFKRAETTGLGEYPEAAEDVVSAELSLARALLEDGAAQSALEHFEHTALRSREIGLTELANYAEAKKQDCWTALGRYGDVIEVVRQELAIAEQKGDLVAIARLRYKLAINFTHQQKTEDALREFSTALPLVRRYLPNEVGKALGNMGLLQMNSGDLEGAERSLQEALRDAETRDDVPLRTGVVNTLGNVYLRLKKHGDAATMFANAAEAASTSGNRRLEAFVLNNLGMTLIELERFAEARAHLVRAVALKRELGHAAEPWTTLDLLKQAEEGLQNMEGAVAAREAAILAYMAYRSAGGEARSPGGKLCEVVAAKGIAARPLLADIQRDPRRRDWRVLTGHLLAILDGSRDSSLAEDPRLFYPDAAELRLLMDALSLAAQGRSSTDSERDGANE